MNNSTYLENGYIRKWLHYMLTASRLLQTMFSLLTYLLTGNEINATGNQTVQREQYTKRKH